MKLPIDEILTGDCCEVMKTFPANSIDLVVTDPPYFMINVSGKGFMGKEWDSLNSRRAYNILCQSKEFAHFVSGFFWLVKADLNMVEVNSARLTVKTKGSPNQNLLDLNVRSVENISKGENPMSKVNISSVQGIVLTKGEVLDLLNELSLNPTILSVFQNLDENALFVIPLSYLKRKLKNIVPENVLKLPIAEQCVERITLLTSMAETKIRGVIEGIIGSSLGYKSMKETSTDVESVENIANERKYKHITLNLTDKQKITRWIIWLLYALHVIQKRKTYSRITINYDLICKFHKNWALECLRILKPGALTFIMCGPRQDILWRTLSAIEECGFQLRQSFISWIYKSGFPKAYDVSKGIDKKVGRSRKRNRVIHPRSTLYGDRPWIQKARRNGVYYGESNNPISNLAKKWEGWKSQTGLKPALECVLMVNKPFSEKTIVDNVLRWGTGAINVDKCRIPFSKEGSPSANRWAGNKPIKSNCTIFKTAKPTITLPENQKGRFPANLLVSDGALNTGKTTGKSLRKNFLKRPWYSFQHEYFQKHLQKKMGYPDVGDQSRYFDLDAWARHRGFLDVPKASKRERDVGLIKFVKGKVGHGNLSNSKGFERFDTYGKNVHPTVKPVKLMAYLIELGCPPDGVVLDPFVGSGTTCVAAKKLERNWIGIEINRDYVEIARARLAAESEKLTAF